MKPQSGSSLSFWASTAEVPQYKYLLKDITADVCVVGAGITGLTTAYLLAKEGKKVVVIDSGPVGGGESGRTTAHITNIIDDRYYKIESWHGEKGARLAAESQTAAIDEIERIVMKEKIDCDFERVPGYLFFMDDQSNDIIDKELQAIRNAGIPANEDPAPPVKLTQNRCLKVPRQAQFHILKYLSGLCRAIERDGGQIFTETHASSIEGGKVVRIRTDRGALISASSAVVATNSPISNYVSIHTKSYPYRSYVIGAKIPRGSVEKALYWDDGEPYHYVRVHEINEDPKHEMLIIGGEDHKTGQENDAEDRYAALEEWARERFPMMKRVELAWSGQVFEPVDGLSFIGPEPEGKENVYISTGDSGMGMTHATFSAMILRDMLAGRKNPWTELYNPKRKTLKTVGEFVRENVNMAAQYTEWVSPAEVDTVAEIPEGEGAIMRHGLKRVAVFRDNEGQIHKFSATCTHLGCVVQWNSGEKSWDCPCHGSRFNSLGTVLTGPAINDLKKFEEEQE